MKFCVLNPLISFVKSPFAFSYIPSDLFSLFSRDKTAVIPKQIFYHIIPTFFLPRKLQFIVFGKQPKMPGIAQKALCSQPLPPQSFSLMLPRLCSKGWSHLTSFCCLNVALLPASDHCTRPSLHLDRLSPPCLPWLFIFQVFKYQFLGKCTLTP